jgi:alginate O-acetyltransferase complex protein AlgI
MYFSSFSFIFFFFPIVFLMYYLLSSHRGMQNIWLFLVGIIFYAWGDPEYIILLLASILYNWIIGIWIEKKHNKELLVFGIICNLSILFIYKYLAPYGENYGLDITLPIGISIYTFQAISYIVDVYRKEIEAEKNPIYVGLYISFFPKVLLGPLMQYASFKEQIKYRKSTLRKCGVGACRFITGLGKKVLLAGNLEVLSDIIFNYSSMGRENFQVPAIMAWMGLVAFLLQVYFDFSGYCDMAIGLGLMFGFRLDENFDYPYSSLSVRDFWRRWNITLMNWFHRYVYAPLGGSPYKNKDTVVRSLLITWVVIGIWHGAKGNYLLWGLWNCAFVLVEYFLGFAEKNKNKGLMRVYTLIVIGLGFVLLRASDTYQAGQYYMNMFAANYNGLWNGLTGFLLKEYGIFLIVGAVFSLPIAKAINQRLVKDETSLFGTVWTYAYPVVMFGVLLLSLSYLAGHQVTGFWYLRY